jgi:UDPglucose 6-dehydrogenase
VAEKIGITGYGWVGKAQHELFPDAVVYDPYLKLGSKALINECSINFIAVPTPNKEDGSLDTSAVEEVAEWCESDLIVIRSTVQPGTADRLKALGKRVVSQPEYLGESVAHPLLDQGSRPFMILGGDKPDTRKVIEAYQGVYNANINIRQTTNLEAEVIKLSENRAIAFKVAQAQELYDVCERAGVDYYTVREAVYGDDPRFNRWFTFVYPERRGMDSKCIPKDPVAWLSWAESLGYDAKVTRAILDKNEEWTGRPNNPNAGA